MRIPRDISADDLIKVLRRLDYVKTRQVGSHVRLTTMKNGQHHLTIPYHSPIKIGTLSAILSDVAEHFNKTKEEIVRELFG